MNTNVAFGSTRKDTHSPEIAVAVLAGGASSRFGSDKGMVRLCPGGPTVIERVVAIGRGLSSETVVIGHARYADLPLEAPVIPDRFPGEGPLAALLTALSATSAPRLLLLACDSPCLSTRLLQEMMAIRTDAELLIPRTADGRWHPMPGIYRRSIETRIEDRLASGARSFISLLDCATVRALEDADLRRLDPNLDSIFSLNRIDQLERARRCAPCS